MNPFKPNHDHNLEEYQIRMDRIVKILTEFRKETDRGMSILGAALLDEKLKIILSNFLIQGKPFERLINGPNAPIGTFSSRLDMAYAVGLISEEEHHDTEIIRKIRNDFAHKFDLEFSFNNSSVSDRCDNIILVKDTIKQMRSSGQIISAKEVFGTAITHLAYSWMFREEHARQLKLEAPDWRRFLFPNASA